MLFRELLIFALFFLLQQFLFAVVGNLLFYDTFSYRTLGESMLTIFKASGGVFVNKDLSFAEQESRMGYLFILSYMILCFVLILNLIVG